VLETLTHHHQIATDFVALEAVVVWMTASVALEIVVAVAAADAVALVVAFVLLKKRHIKLHKMIHTTRL